MTVYVDDLRMPARVGKVTARWSHLTVGPGDDLAELHALAARIGLRREWFQDKPWPRAHYDVTDSKRRAAIAAGAVPVTWREAARQRLKALDTRHNLDEWACETCQDAYFGTRPDDGLCGSCRGGAR